MTTETTVVEGVDPMDFGHIPKDFFYQRERRLGEKVTKIVLPGNGLTAAPENYDKMAPPSKPTCTHV